MQLTGKLQIVFILFFTVSVANAQLTVDPGGFITINPTGSMYVGTNLQINSDASGSGYWVDRTTGNDVTISGTVDIERYLGEGGWHNTASPVNNSVSTIYSGTDLVFYYDETIILNDWNFGWVWHTGALDVMKGYDVYIASPLLVDYTSSSGSSLNSGNYSISVTRTDGSNGESESHKGWNLIGNPYPSPVDWLEETGWNKTDINDAKYIWNPGNNNYTIFMGGSNPTGVNGGTQFIPSNQGFWVQAMHNGTVEINNTCRTGTMASTPDYYKNSDNKTNELRITASGNGYNDETLIRFLPTATNQFDVNQDAGKLFSSFDSIPQIYTLADNDMLAINSLSGLYNGLKVPLEFFCNTKGEYKLTIDDTDEFVKQNRVYLRDLRNQKTIDFGLEKQYTFYHDPGFSVNRFIIYINPTDELIDSLAPDSWFSVSTIGNALTVQRNTHICYRANLSIYNLLGQLIYTTRLSDTQKSTYTIDAPQGYYLVTIQTINHLLTVKIFLSG